MDLFVSTRPLFGDSYVLHTTLCAAVHPPNALNHAYDFLRLVRDRAVASLLDIAEMTYTFIFGGFISNYIAHNITCLDITSKLLLLKDY